MAKHFLHHNLTKGMAVLLRWAGGLFALLQNPLALPHTIPIYWFFENNHGGSHNERW